ncbi:MAG: ThiF family adenylyltransferase [Alphaproteobacteria bacterium]
MYRQLASHNDDIRRLVDKGYAVAVDSTNCLIIRDIPYLDLNRALKMGAFVAKLVYTTPEKVRQENHQVFFTGSLPHNLDGTPITNIGGGEATLTLSDAAADVVVTRQFSNKPIINGQKVEYVDFFAKIENYTSLISGPAMALYPEKANPFTFRAVQTSDDSVFKIRDTLTSRAEITELAQKFKNEIVAIIGLGGTGAYLLDFMTKTPVKEVRGFDGDRFHIHNAFRSPGRFEKGEFDESKAVIYQARYENLRHGVRLIPKYVDATSGSDFAGVTFAFVCVDKGTARKEIFDLLIANSIPFIDVGMGLNRKHGSLSGQLRATYYSKDEAATRREKGFATLADHPNEEYRVNIQIAELNALNAALAVIEYKKLKGFYFDENSGFHFHFRIADSKIIVRSANDEIAED